MDIETLTCQYFKITGLILMKFTGYITSRPTRACIPIFRVVALLDVYVSFPGMMQDDKGNIKVSLGIASVSRLAGFYCGISVFCLYTDMALYNTGSSMWATPVCE